MLDFPSTGRFRRRDPFRLILVATALASVLTGCSDEKPAPEPTPAGGSETDRGDAPPADRRFRPARDATMEEKIEALETLGYTTGSKSGGEAKGVTRYLRRQAGEGVNLYTSGQGPVAVLMSMDGKILHRWRLPFHRAFPDVPEDLVKRYQFGDYFRRVHLFPNGDLLAIFEGQGLIKTDRNSDLLFAFDGHAHHDLDVDGDGNIHVLTRKAHVVSNINPTEPVLEDFVTTLDEEGEVVGQLSVLRAFLRSPFREYLNQMPDEGDLLHTNTLEILDGSLVDRIPAFKEGNLLISCLMIDTIAVIDPNTREVVWAARHDWDAQHQPTLLQNGNILLFDNLGGQGKGGRSRVIEMEPTLLKTVWEYSGTENAPFQTDTCGSSQRLPNGNTLITESDYGRAFEVAPDGTIVWEYIVPHRAGKNREYIATLFEMIRLPPDFPLDWVQGKASGKGKSRR